jgi:hypothetical protein
MTPVDTLGEPVTVVDALGEPVVLINNDGTPAFLAYSAKTYLGGVAPYHWLDFVNNRALYAGADVGNVTQATGYSFTRASDGYYTNADGTLTLFGSGALRRGDRGVLIEGARTNLLTYSQQFDNAAWGKQNSAVTANTTVAPNGTTTADTVTANAGAAFHYVNRSALPTSGSEVFSFFAKKGTSSWIFFTIRDVSINYFNFDTGSFGTTPNTCTATALANGWWRITVTATVATAAGCGIGVASGDGGASFTAAGTETVIVWGGQAEANTFASSYIPTVAAAATRAADVLTYTAGVSYPLSLWAEFERAVDTGANESLVAVEASAIERAVLRAANSDIGQVVVIDGGVTVANPTVAGVLTVGAVYKLSARIATDSVQIARGVTLGTEDVSATMPDAPTSLRIGTITGGSDPSFNYIRRIAVFNSALTDAQLQTTTS